MKSMAKKNGYRDFSCDICGSRRAIEMPHCRRYTKGQAIHICKECGFVYVKARRPYDRIARIWSKELFGMAYTSKTPLMLARHTYIAEFIHQSSGLKNKRVCDIGAGEGQFLSLIKKDYGASVFGIEPSAANCAMMKRARISYFEGALEDYMQSKSSTKYKADIATMMWTLENATSPNDLVMGARQILKDNGYLVVATGSRILVPFAKPIWLYLSSNPVDTHPSRFSINTLRLLLSKCGFEIEHANQYLNDSFLMCVIARKTKIRDAGLTQGDDYRKVRDFFKRWHRESAHYIG